MPQICVKNVKLFEVRINDQQIMHNNNKKT